MSKSLKINLILISIIVLATVGIFNFTNAITKGLPPPFKPYIRPACTGTTDCTSWGICINGIKTCDSNGYSLLPSSNCVGTIPAPTTTCPASENARTASGYAWSDNIGYISFSGSVTAAPEVCIPDSPLTQTLSCPTGQTGSITQTRTSTCPGPVTSDWTTTSNTCVTPVTCIPDSPLTQTLSCPTGQTGSITQTRTSTCPTGASNPTTSAWSTTTIACTPNAPTSLVATSDNLQVSLVWNWDLSLFFGPFPVSWNVYRSVSASGPFSLIKNTNVLPSATIPYIDSGLIGGGTYYYKISSQNSIGESTFSNTASVNIAKVCTWGTQNYANNTFCYTQDKSCSGGSAHPYKCIDGVWDGPRGCAYFYSGRMCGIN